jgi:hypothetical protein
VLAVRAFPVGAVEVPLRTPAYRVISPAPGRLAMRGAGGSRRDRCDNARGPTREPPIEPVDREVEMRTAYADYFTRRRAGWDEE